jgi:hypothetical protein
MSSQLKKFKREQEKISEKKLESKKYPKELVIVAEGDSWFNYPLKKDIIDYLRGYGYAIKSHAKAGDTLENMVYGTAYSKLENNEVKHLGPESFQKTISAIKKLKPAFFLFSAGGNDIVGSEIISYLNHKYDKTSETINQDIFKAKLKRIGAALEFYIQAIIKTDKKIHILMDGYDYAKVNGKGYSFIFKNIKGPWILPSMAMKGITNKKEQAEIIEYFVDQYNILLKKLDKKYDQFNYIDLRGNFPTDAEWDNEIHLKNTGFKIIASIYHDKICVLLNHNPIIEYKEEILVFK